MEDEDSPALRAGVDFRGTENATERVTEHVKPGKARAPVMRYIRINLPRTTRLFLLFVVAVIGAASAAVVLAGHEPFPLANPALWAISGASIVFVAVGLTTSARIWVWGAGIAVVSLLVYAGGIAGDAPYVWNDASVILAALWNTTLLASIGYLALFWALRYGLLVAAPDDQNFMD